MNDEISNNIPGDSKPPPADMLEKLAQVKLLCVDVDGILTDGGIYYADDGNSFRKFNAKDGLGLARLLKSGVEVAIISGGAAGAIEHRAKRLGIRHVFTDIHDKLSVLQDLARKLGIEMDAVAHIGDDINDLPLMRAAGVSITAKDAVDEVLSYVDMVTKRPGGHGAVRELCDAIHVAQGGEPA